MKWLPILSLIVLFTGCCKDEICSSNPDPCPIEPCGDTTTSMGKLDTLWTVKLTESGRNPGENRGVEIQAQNVILTYSNDPVGMIACYDASNNGLRKWLFNASSRGFISSHVSRNTGLLINKTWGNRLTIDINSGELKEFISSDEGSGPRGNLIGDFLYYYETESQERIAHLRRSPVAEMALTETIYTLGDDEIRNEKKSIESVNLWQHPQTGDSILIFQHRMAIPNRVDVVAWNLSKRELLWRKDNVTRLGNSNHQQIVIHNDKAYFSGATDFICFDLFTGDIKWQFAHPSGLNSFLFYKPVIAEREGLLVVRDASGETRGFNLNTGSVAWHSNLPGVSSATAGSPVYDNGIVYFTERGLLYAMRATNGQLLWSESSAKTQFQTSSFRGEIAIDREKGILYVTDQDELFAIKVYKD